MHHFTNRQARKQSAQASPFVAITFVLSLDTRGAEGRYVLSVGHTAPSDISEKKTSLTAAKLAVRSSSGEALEYNDGCVANPSCSNVGTPILGRAAKRKLSAARLTHTRRSQGSG